MKNPLFSATPPWDGIKMRKNKRHGSVYVYLVLVFFLLLVPITLMSIFVLTSSAQVIRRQQEEAVAAQLFTQKVQLEADIKKMQSRQSLFIINEDIAWSFTEKYYAMDKTTRVRAISRLAKSLYMVKDSNALVADVHLYIPSLQIEIGDDGFYEANPERIDTELYEQAFQSKKSVFFHNGRLYSAAAFLTSPTRTSSCCVVVEWNVDLFPFYWVLKVKGAEFVFFNEEYSAFSDMDTQRRKALLDSLSDTSADAKAPVTQEFEYDGKEYIVSLIYSELLDGTMVSYQPLSVVTGTIQQYVYFAVIIGLAGLCAALVAMLACRRIVKRPLDKLLAAFVQVQEGNLDVQIRYNGNNEFSTLIECFNTMVERLHTLIEENYSKEIRLKNTMLRQLQVQISPHFLYNSFSIIAHSIRIGDTQSALLMTRSLSEYFHYVTQNNQDTELLSNELRFAQTYMNIQSIRFGDRIEVTIEEPEEQLLQLEVPRMIIQPLVENAYKHAFRELESDGKLILTCLKEDSNLVIRVCDNGTGIPEEALKQLRESLLQGTPGEHNGLFNVYERIWLRYGNREALKLYNTGDGLCVEIRIPLEGS